MLDGVIVPANAINDALVSGDSGVGSAVVVCKDSEHILSQYASSGGFTSEIVDAGQSTIVLFRSCPEMGL